MRRPLVDDARSQTFTPHTHSTIYELLVLSSH